MIRMAGINRSRSCQQETKAAVCQPPIKPQRRNRTGRLRQKCGEVFEAAASSSPEAETADQSYELNLHLENVSLTHEARRLF